MNDDQDRSKISLKHIAEAAGVSKVTVSRALRNHPNLPEKTRNRIQQLAAKMGYIPDPKLAELMARLRSRQAHTHQSTIAALWDSPDLTTAAGHDWSKHQKGENEMMGIRERCAELGYQLDEFFLKDYSADGRQLTRVLWNRGIAGIILVACAKPGTTVHLDWSRFSAVTSGFTLKSPDLPRVATDHFRTMLQIMKNLQQKGYRRIGLAVSETVDNRVQNQWRAGYLVHNSLHPPEHTLPVLINSQMKKSDFVAWMDEHRPDVIISGGDNDLIWNWLQELRIRIPKDLGFVSFHLKSYPADSSFITGMDHQNRLKGRAAVDMLVRQLHSNEIGIPSQPGILLLPARWVSGQTIRDQ